MNEEDLHVRETVTYCLHRSEIPHPALALGHVIQGRLERPPILTDSLAIDRSRRKDPLPTPLIRLSLSVYPTHQSLCANA